MTPESLLAHYERVFGAPSRVSHFKLAHGDLAVAAFDNTPCEAATTFCTVGLTPSLHQELLFSCYSPQVGDETVKLVGAVAKQLLESNCGLERGQVLGPAGPIQSSALVDAFYVCPPVYYPANLERRDADGTCSVDFYWLVPVYREEAKWVARYDDDSFRFETLLQEQDPDLLDLRRKMMALPPS